MSGRRALLVNLLVIFFGRLSAISISHCDMATTARVPEGNIGQTSDFNWLGVLRVHLHDGDTLKVAASGIVLIHSKYAIAHADDIARIPERIFRTDTQAMFLVGVGTPWYVMPKHYVTHPEYEYATINSISIIEFDVDEIDRYPLNPICLPSISYNASKHLYVLGYTDENKLLEKVLYKVQYLPEQSCEEFYNRAGLSDKLRTPVSYVCGYSPYNSTQCVWDNGMSLVSNATGWFTLIGFGVRGPGCAAPARFIDLQPYFPWINSVMNLDQIYDDPGYRREDSIEYIPAHELFKENSENASRRKISNLAAIRHFFPYPFDVEKPRHFTIEPTEPNVIAIFPFNQTLEMFKNTCGPYKQLLYREYFEVSADDTDMRGSVVYKLSLYDLYSTVCSCVELTIECTRREEAVLSFKETFQYDLGTALGESGETPEHLFRYFPVYNPTPKPKPGDRWKPSPNLKPQYLKQGDRFRNVLNYDLYIKFEFDKQAVMKFEMFSNPAPPPKTTTSPYFTPTTTTQKKKKLQRLWGARINKKIKDPNVPLVVEQEIVQQTVSKASRMTLPMLILLELNVLSKDLLLLLAY